MATSTSTSHEDRTSHIPRAAARHTAKIDAITQATRDVRMIDFSVTPPGPFKFKAGQWVDTFTPASERAGGFSLVSSPAAGLHDGTFRLAIKRADANPPAAWLWRDTRALLGASVDVQVGGDFTFPPVNVRKLGGKVSRVTLIAGGIGSNPLISILAALRDAKAPLSVSMLYGIKDPHDALYLEELEAFTRPDNVHLDLSVFCSASADTQGLPGTVHQRRFDDRDLDATIRGEKDTNLYYICGPAQMTDYVQEYLLKRGVLKDLVQTERWW